MSNSQQKLALPEVGKPLTYRRFSAREWGALRAETPLPLSEDELAQLRGRGETISLSEVEQIYLPLSRLLNLYIAATQTLYESEREFLGTSHAKTPYIVGLAGSVAVGKSTTARILRTLLARWPNHPRVNLVTTDGFLYPNAVLERRGLMSRKGFPESFDVSALIDFLSDVKSGLSGVSVPVYSHASYDIVPDETLTIDQSDILIVEGLNVLQTSRHGQSYDIQPYVSDFFDFSVFLDADEEIIRHWYIDRFLELRRTAFRDPNAYFHRYAALNDDETKEVANDIWTSINLVNLQRNILPTRARADLVLRKSADHAINEVWLRKL
ncbi:MAG: type I pantothenate kinase [Parvularculales bacterium]